MKTRMLWLYCFFFPLIPGCVIEKAELNGLEDNVRWVSSSAQVFYLKTDSANRASLFRSNINGKNVRKLVDGPIHEYMLSPDGHKVAYLLTNNSGCGIVNLNDSSRLLVSEQCEGIDWSPSSQEVSFNTDEHSIAVFSVASGKFKEIFSTPDIVVGPRWSKDGSSLYFNTLHSQEYFRLEHESGEIKKIGSSVPTSASEAEKKNRQGWEHFVDPSEMHFNQVRDRLHAYWKMLSPSGNYLADNERGSLVIVSAVHKTERKVIVRNIGGYNSDFGQTGFMCPLWIQDETYIIGQFRDSIVVAEVATGRIGVLTEGEAPLTHMPNFRPRYSLRNPMYNEYYNTQ